MSRRQQRAQARRPGWTHPESHCIHGDASGRDRQIPLSNWWLSASVVFNVPATISIPSARGPTNLIPSEKGLFRAKMVCIRTCHNCESSYEVPTILCVDALWNYEQPEDPFNFGAHPGCGCNAVTCRAVAKSKSSLGVEAATCEEHLR